MFRYLTLATCIVLASSALNAEDKEQGRLEQVGIVMQEVLDVPDNIPQELLEKAECVIVIPSMTKVALGIGGRKLTASAIVTGTRAVAVPESGRHFVDVLEKGAPRNESKRATR